MRVTVTRSYCKRSVGTVTNGNTQEIVKSVRLSIHHHKETPNLDVNNLFTTISRGKVYKYLVKP